MENNSITKLILGFLVLIVGLALIASVAEGSNDNTKLAGASETLDIADARLGTGSFPFSIDPTQIFTVAQAPTSGWRAQGGCALTDLVILNQTGVAATVTTDYVLWPNNGSLFLKNTTKFTNSDGTASSNTTSLTYTYCPDGYMNIAWGRSILDLISGFFALALLGVGVGLFYSVARDAGLVSK